MPRSRISKLRFVAHLLRDNGKVVEIRRAETVDDYFATLDFDILKRFRWSGGL